MYVYFSKKPLAKKKDNTSIKLRTHRVLTFETHRVLTLKTHRVLTLGTHRVLTPIIISIDTTYTAENQPVLYLE